MSNRRSDAAAVQQIRGVSVIVVMGVAGSGKSTIGTLLARQLDWAFADADSFHPASNVEKMSRGVPLTDDDRLPWLEAIATWMEGLRRNGQRGIVTCSALKRAYRKILVGGHADTRIVYLKGERELIASRMAARTGHFMPVGLLDSQFKTLEEPGPEENPIVVAIDAPPQAMVDAILQELGGR
jgi:carbohydrate kinase (thermoresistant glucokinase family)